MLLVLSRKRKYLVKHDSVPSAALPTGPAFAVTVPDGGRVMSSLCNLGTDYSIWANLLTQSQKPNQKSEQICPAPFLKYVCSGKLDANAQNGSILIWAYAKKQTNKKYSKTRHQL